MLLLTCLSRSKHALPIHALNGYRGGRSCFSNKSSQVQPPPLRILFCGSDEFSTGSLRALHEEQQRNPASIQSIDVLCRPGKRTGRSLKVVREVPIKGVAEELGLVVHQRDTFTGWNLPRPDGEPINLIVAVSFGLFVPPRILKSAAYGGLNVHPSLLPNLRGAAPLQWTIMEGHKETGVTLQTLDDKSFDHGKILLQTPPLDLDRLGLYKPTYPILRDLVTVEAKRLLVQGIRDRVFVPPLKEVLTSSTTQDLVFARKLKSKDAEVDWSKSSVQIARQYRALGPLWTIVQLEGGRTIRVKLDDIEEVPHTGQEAKGLIVVVGSNGEHVLDFTKGKDGSIIVRRDMQPGVPLDSNGECDLRVGNITIEGRSKVAARMAAEMLKRIG